MEAEILPHPVAASAVFSTREFPGGIWEAPPRRIYCAHYQSCLYTADQQEWPGWSCTSCNVTEEISEHQQLVDFHGLADVYWEIMKPEPPTINDDLEE